MNDSQRVELVIEDRAGPLTINEFTQFLIHLRAVYAVAAGASPERDVDPMQAIEHGNFIAGYLRQMDLSFLKLSITKAASSSLGTELSFVDIQRVNPIKVTLVGSISALAAAILICGGSIEVIPNGTVRAFTPGLVQSIINMAHVFGLATGTASNPADIQTLPASPLNIDKNQSTGAKASSATTQRMSMNSSRKK